MGYDAEVVNYLFGINPGHEFKGERRTVPISLRQDIKVRLLPVVQNLFCLFHHKTRNYATAGLTSSTQNTTT